MALKVLSKDGFYGWINLVVVFLFYIAMMLMLSSFTVFLPSWLEEFRWSAGWASGSQQMGMILSGLAAPLVGRYIMKRGTKRAIVLGNLLNLAGLVLLAYMKDMWQLYIGNGILIGMGIAIGGMLAIMTVINNWFIMKRSIALAVSMAGMGLSGSVMIPALIRLIDSIGWRDTYLLVAAVVSVFCVIIPGIFLKNKPEDLGQVPDGPASQKPGAEDQKKPVYKNLYKTPVEFTAREAMRTGALWLLVAYGTLQFFTLNVMMTQHLNFLYAIEIPKNIASWAIGFFNAIMAVSQLGIGLLGLRFKMHYLAIIAMAIGVAGFGCLLFAAAFTEFPILIFVYCALLGIGFGIQSIAMGNLFPDYFGRTEFPKIMGYTMPINILISSFGGTTAGIILDKTGSYTLAFQICLGIMIAGLICIVFAKPPIHPSLKNHPDPQLVSMTND
jgi:MFS family permease